MALVPPLKTLSPQRREAMQQASQQLLANMPRPQDRIVRLSVAPLAGDYTGEVTQALRDQLDGEGIHDVPPSPIKDRLRRRLHLDQQQTMNAEAALKAGRSAGAERVLWGRINRLAELDGRAAADLELSLYDVPSKRLLWQDKVDSAKMETPAAPRAGASVKADMTRSTLPGRMASTGARVAISLLFAVLLSLAAIPFILRILAHESNALNMMMLASLTALDACVTLLILYPLASRTVCFILVFILAIVSGWYNYWFCEIIEKKR
jgi:hypothetical protein